MTSPQCQPQVQAVVAKLVAFHPDQTCVEWLATRQPLHANLYPDYQQGRYRLESDEIYQLGLQTDRHLHLPRLTAVNYRGDFDAEQGNAYARQHQSPVLVGLDAFAK